MDLHNSITDTWNLEVVKTTTQHEVASENCSATPNRNFFFSLLAKFYIAQVFAWHKLHKDSLKNEKKKKHCKDFIQI